MAQTKVVEGNAIESIVNSFILIIGLGVGYQILLVLISRMLARCLVWMAQGFNVGG